MKPERDDLYPIFSIISFLTWAVTLLFSVLINLLLLRLRILGRNHLRACASPCFVISNHNLYLDPCEMIHALAPRRVCMTALSPTVRMPWIGPFLRLLGCMPVTGIGMRTIARRSIRLMRNGWFVQMMPEGELRHLADDLGPFKTGVFSLSIMLDKPVLPYVVRRKPIRVFGRVLHPAFANLEVEFGPPVFPGDFARKGQSPRRAAGKFRDYCRNKMKKMLDNGRVIS